LARLVGHRSAVAGSEQQRQGKERAQSGGAGHSGILENASDRFVYAGEPTRSMKFVGERSVATGLVKKVASQRGGNYT
jgi:hypothetical protein